MRFVKAFLLLLTSTLCLAQSPVDRLTAPIESGLTVPLKGNLHGGARPEFDQGRVDGGMEMQTVSFVFKPSPAQQSALDQLLAQQQDRLSPNYHRWLTPVQFGNRFGMSKSDISKVTSWNQLDEAIALARKTDPKVLVEAAVVGREVECGVLEFPDGRVEASLPAEIRMLSEETNAWYDFETKYLAEDAELDIPAKLNDVLTERLRATAVKAFRALDCQGLARVDFFVGEDGELTINEVNTMPGFTTKSAYPKMWEVTGVDYPTLLSTLIETAIARGTGLR